MRHIIALLGILLAGVLLLEKWQPFAAVVQTATSTSPATPLPDNFTLIPTFVSASPCDLQNVEVYDDKLCRRESVSERTLISGDGVSFIVHEYQIGQGCWDSVNQQIRELRVCTQSSGAMTTLSEDFVTDLIASPDGEWLAFGTMNRLSTGIESIRPHVYRVRIDGSDLQKLDTQSFGGYRVGAPRDLHWEDANWLAFSLWDGTDGYYPYRLKADGSGTYEEGGKVTFPQTATPPPSPTLTPSPIGGAPIIEGTPPPPQPTGTLIPN